MANVEIVEKIVLLPHHLEALLEDSLQTWTLYKAFNALIKIALV